MLKITNTQTGPRGVNAVVGPVLVDPGQTVEVEVYRREKQHIDATGWFDVSGTYKADPDEAPAPLKPVEDSDEVKALRARIAELEAEKGKDGDVPALEAKHRGGGRYSVMDADGKEVVSGLSKDDAAAFNAMSEADKAAFVAPKDGEQS